MKTPFSNRDNPLSTLPEPFRKSLAGPFKAFTGVTAVFVLLLLFARLFAGDLVSADHTEMANQQRLARQHALQQQNASDRRAEARPAASSAEPEVKVQGEVSFKIKYKDKGYRAYIDTTRYKLESSAGQLELSSPETGKRYRLKIKPGKINLYDPQNSVLYRFIRQEDGDYVLKGIDGAQIFRIKVKPDSYNIYNSSQVRVLKGKSKGGYITVKTKPGDQRVLKIEGEGGFAPAGALSLPVAVPYRVLLWRYLKTRSS